MREQSKALWIWVYFFESTFFTRSSFRIFNAVRRRHRHRHLCPTKSRKKCLNEWENQRKPKHCPYLFLLCMCSTISIMLFDFAHKMSFFYVQLIFLSHFIRFQFEHWSVASHGVIYIESVLQQNEQKNVRSKYSSENNCSPFVYAYIYQWRSIEWATERQSVVRHN